MQRVPKVVLSPHDALHEMLRAEPAPGAASETSTTAPTDDAIPRRTNTDDEDEVISHKVHRHG